MDAAPTSHVLAGTVSGLKAREEVVGFGTNSVNTVAILDCFSGVGGTVTIPKTSLLAEARHRRANFLAKVSVGVGRMGGSSRDPLSWLVRRVATGIGQFAEYIRPDSGMRLMDVITGSLGGEIYTTTPQRSEPSLSDTAVTVKPIDPSVEGRGLDGSVTVRNRRAERKLRYMGYLAAHPVRLPVIGAEIAHELKFKLLVMKRNRVNEDKVSLIAADYIDGKCRSSKDENGDARFADMRPQTKRLIQMYAVKLYFMPSPDEIVFHEMFNDPEIVAAMHWRSQLAAPSPA